MFGDLNRLMRRPVLHRNGQLASSGSCVLEGHDDGLSKDSVTLGWSHSIAPGPLGAKRPRRYNATLAADDEQTLFSVGMAF